MLIKDPRIIETYSQALMFEPSANVTEEDRIRLRDALAVLTDREEMLLLHKAECFSYERIAALLNVKKSTVQTTVKRALLKIQNSRNKEINRLLHKLSYVCHLEVNSRSQKAARLEAAFIIDNHVGGGGDAVA